MAALTVWTREEMRAREEVFQALVAKALRLSARSLETQVDGLLTAAAAPGIEPEPEARSAAFALALGELGTVQATWTARVDGELWPYLTQTFADAAADTAKIALDATGRSGPAPTQSLIAQALAFLRAKLLALGGWLAQKLTAKLRAGYDAGDGARQLAARIKIAAADALPVAANGAADALGWAATLGELTQLQAAGFTDNDVEKEWLTSDDDRVRPEHAAADGQRVGLFRSFDVGGEQLFAPRDPTGRPDNVLGCRCSLGYIFNDVSDSGDDGDAELTAAADPDWDASEHPRAPKGTGEGGQFIKKSAITTPTTTASSTKSKKAKNAAVAPLASYPKVAEPPKTTGMHWFEQRAAAKQQAETNRVEYAKLGPLQARVAQFVTLWTGMSTQSYMKKEIYQGKWDDVLEVARDGESAPVLYRGFSLKVAKGKTPKPGAHATFMGDPQKFIDNLKIGTELDLGGMASFTEDKEHAETFGDVLFVLKDGRGLPIESISNTPFEHEWLLTGKMRVTGATKKGKQYLVDVELVSPGGDEEDNATAATPIPDLVEPLPTSPNNATISPGTTAYGQAAAKKVAKVTAAQVKAQIDAAKIPVGPPLHINTNVIYKTKYDDGAVVAVNPSTAARLRWSAPDKAFLYQERQSAGHWNTIAKYGKGDAYKKFSKEDGWHAPAPATSTSSTPKLTVPAAAPPVPLVSPSPPSIMPDGGIPQLTKMSPKAVVAWLEDLSQEDYDELTPFDKSYIDTVAGQTAFDGGAAKKLVNKLKAGQGGDWTPPTAPLMPPAPAVVKSTTAGTSVPLKINTAVVYKTKYAHGAVVAEKPGVNEAIFDERFIWDADKKKFTLERYLPDKGWVKVKDYNKGQIYKTYSDEEGWFAPGKLTAVPAASTAAPPVTPAATTSHKKTVPDFSKMSPDQANTWFEALTKDKFDALSAEEKQYLGDHAYGEELFGNTVPQDKLNQIIKNKSTPNVTTYGPHQSTDLHWANSGPVIDGDSSVVLKYPKTPGSKDLYFAGYAAFGEGNEVKLYDANVTYVKSLHSDDLSVMKELITDEVNAGGGKIVADADDGDALVPTPAAPTSTTSPPKYTPGVIPNQKDQLSGYIHQELIPTNDIGKPDPTYVGEYPVVDQATMSLTQAGMLAWAGKKWTPQEIQAVQRYTTSVGYQTTNAVLRNDQTRMNMFSISQLQDGVKNAQALQSAMTPTVVGGIKVFRGTGAQAFGAPGNDMSLADLKKLEGKVISDPGFVSTTILNEKSTGFDYTKKPIRMEIEVPPGTPGLYVSSATPGYASENEFILAAGTNFEIMEVRAATPAEKAAHSSSLKHIVRVRVVPSKGSTGAPAATSSAPVAAPTSSVAPKPVTKIPGKSAPTIVPFGAAIGNHGGTTVPISLNTTTIHKTKYTDGAVVAVRIKPDGQVERLAWLDKKFILQTRSSDAEPWEFKAEYTKKDAYAAFSKDTDWKLAQTGASLLVTTPAPTVVPSGASTSKATPKATSAAAKTTTFDVATLQKMHGDLPPEVEPYKKDLYNHFKNNPKLGTITLGSNPDLVLKSVLDTVKLADDPYGVKLNALQVIKLIDATGIPPGLTNLQLYEKKLIAWLGTADGAHEAAMIISGGTVKTPGLTDLLAAIPKPADLGTPHENDVTFEELTPSAAANMQQQMQSNKSLTQKARDALVAYTGSFYGVINTLLRKGIASSSYGNPTLALERGKLIQESMKPLPRNIITFRGTTAEQFGLGSMAGIDTIKGLIGKTIIDDGFVSTSIDQYSAFTGTIKLIIEAPAGTPARYVGTISSHAHEKELIYAAGTKFKVLTVTQGPYGGTISVRVRVVP